MIPELLHHIADPSTWLGQDAALERVAQHLGYAFLALGVAGVIGLPLGALVGHTRRGERIAVLAANATRAIPSLGLMTLLVLFMQSDLLPPEIALVVLATPSVIAGTYAGIQNVSRNVVDSARALGFNEWQILLRAEVPNAAAFILGGFRNATLQVVATATIAAYISLGGIGRYIFDGLATFDYAQVLFGALLVAIIGVTLDMIWAFSIRKSRRLRRPSTSARRLITSQRPLVQSTVNREVSSNRRTHSLD